MRSHRLLAQCGADTINRRLFSFVVRRSRKRARPAALMHNVYRGQVTRQLGSVHVLMSAGRRVDAPACYGPKKTLYNRRVRWAKKGVWQRACETLAAAGGPACRAGSTAPRPSLS